MTRRFVLLVNPAAARGRGPRALPAVRAELDRLGAPHRTVVTRDEEHAAAEAEAAAGRGETVAALGGDGALRPLLRALRDRATALALIPCGRGNDLARALSIPREPAAAARVAVRGGERPLDVGEVDGVPFMGIASLGFDSDANRIANEARLVRGDAVYLYAALRALAAWSPAAFSVTVDGRGHEATGYSVAVGNSGLYGGGMRLLPDARLDDGELDVLIVKRHSKLRWLRDVPRVFRGAHLPSPFAVLDRGRVVEVASGRPFAIYADGDPIGRTPATVRVRPRCLRVVVPEG